MSRRPLALVIGLATLLGTAGAAEGAGSHARGARAAVCGASCYAAPAGSGALFLFTGHGWGHGVGMSQYGAQGYAQNGWAYDAILAHYYPGTMLAQAPTSTIRVLLANGQKKLTISSPVPFTVTDAAGSTHTLAAGKLTFGPGLKLPVDGQPAQALEPPLTFAPGTGSPLTLGRAYRGQLVVDVVDGKLRAIDVVGLEQYLDGVVPAEMPSTWAPAALQAQAVASRSYALATRVGAAPFDVYADTRSQVYRGVSVEKASTTAAVAATAGEVLDFNGRIATTYFYSTSGGQTESATDVWGGHSLPYLVSVPDPFDLISPYHDWGPVPVPALTVSRSLNVPGTIVGATTTPNAAGRVATLNVVSITAGSPTSQKTMTVAGTLATTKLGLRSTWWNVGMLSLTAPTVTAPVPYGTTVTLTGLVHGVGGVMLEMRNARTPWTDVAPVMPATGGAVQMTEKPSISTDYRLATAKAAASYVRIRVTPRVRLAPTHGAGALSGSERPALPGAPVLVQRQNPAGSPMWTTVARGTVGSSGTFSVAVSLAPGTYRAVVAPGHGYWPGASAPVTVSG
jgi:stage II sporulation protein D